MSSTGTEIAQRWQLRSPSLPSRRVCLHDITSLRVNYMHVVPFYRSLLSPPQFPPYQLSLHPTHSSRRGPEGRSLTPHLRQQHSEKNTLHIQFRGQSIAALQKEKQQPGWEWKAAKAAEVLWGFMNHLIGRKGANIPRRAKLPHNHCKKRSRHGDEQTQRTGE